MNFMLLTGLFSGMTGTQFLMLVLAIVFLTVLMISTGKRMRESRALSGKPARDRYRELQQQPTSTRDVEQVMLELDKVARHVHAQIDTKLARLEALIRDADKRIAAMAAGTEERARGAEVEVTLSAEAPGDDTVDVPDASDERFERIYRLADQGLSAQQIAGKVGRIEGEVELILGLRKARSAPTGKAASLLPSD